MTSPGSVRLCPAGAIPRVFALVVSFLLVGLHIQPCVAQQCTDQDFTISYNGVNHFSVSSANNTCICNQYLGTGGTNVFHGVSRFLGGVGTAGQTTSVFGGLSVAQTSSFTGAATFNGGWTGTSGTLSSTLAVTGGAVFNGGLMSTTGSFTAGLSVAGLAAFSGGLSGTTGAFSSTLSANGGLAATTGTFSATLAVSGVSNFNANVGIFTPNPTAPLTVTMSAAPTGWKEFYVTSTPAWGDGNSYAAISGNTGLMVINPHVPWHVTNNAASVRMGLSGGTASGAWYEVGTGPANSFFIAKNGLSSGKQLEVLSSGQVVLANGLTVNNALTTLNAGLTVSGGLATLGGGVSTTTASLSSTLTVTGAASLNGGLSTTTGTFSSTLAVAGRATFASNVGIFNPNPLSPLSVTVPSTATGFDQVTIASSNAWGDGTNYATVKGAEGFMMSNPHISWYAPNNAAALRLGLSGGAPTGAWYEVGTGPTNNFFIAKGGQAAGKQLEIQSGGLAVLASGLTVSAGLTTLSGGLSSTTGTFSSTLGVTGATTLSSTLGVSGTATFSSSVGINMAPTAPLSVQVPGTGNGFQQLLVTSSTAWGDSTAYVTLQGNGGFMMNNAHISWNSGNGAAAFRMGRSGGSSAGAWYEVGTGPSDSFFVAKNGYLTGRQLEVQSTGRVVLSTGLTVNGALTTLAAGLTVNGAVTTLTSGLTVTGATTLNSGLSVTGTTVLSGSVGINVSPSAPLDIVVPGANAGWNRFQVTGSTAWGDGSNQYVTLGAGSGIMIHNPHITWAAGNNAASIRLGRSGGVATGAWYEVATGPSNDFYIGRDGPGSKRLSIDANGGTWFASGISANGPSLVNSGSGPCCGPYYTFGINENTVATGRVPTIEFHGSGICEGQISLTQGRPTPQVNGNPYSGYNPGARTFVMQSVQGIPVDLRVSGNIYGASKSFAEPHPTLPDHEIVYVSHEGPEHGVYYRGASQLVDGEKVIELPDYFELVVAAEGMTSHLTPHEGPCPNLYAASVTPQRLVVRSSVATDQCKFSYLIQGVRASRPFHDVVRPLFNSNATAVPDEEKDAAAAAKRAASVDDDDEPSISLDM